MTGRQTLCTPETTKAICDNIALGLNNRDAATLAGVSERSFYDWLQWGNRELERVAASPRRRVQKRKLSYTQFSQSVDRAVPLRKQVLVGRIQRAAQGGAEYTETKTVYKADGGTETTTVSKHFHPEWTASAWLLERLHPDEFGRRQRVDVYDWRTEVIEMLRAGTITPEEVHEQLGHEYAAEILKSAGVSIPGDGQPAGPGEAENGTGKNGMA